MSTRTRDRTDFGERLYQARMHAKLSQKDLADKVRLSQNNVSHLETHGLGTPKVSQLAAACGVRVEWLSDDKGPMVAEDGDLPAVPGAEEQLASYGGRGPDYQTVVHTLADVLEEAGTEVTVRQFIKMADTTYRKFSK